MHINTHTKIISIFQYILKVYTLITSAGDKLEFSISRLNESRNLKFWSRTQVILSRF